MKHDGGGHAGGFGLGFARQQWRAWIETRPTATSRPFAPRDSPASNGGRGLKPSFTATLADNLLGFARQQWRAWIETACSAGAPTQSQGFARQQWRAWIETRVGWWQWQRQKDSPASNGGRGLKRAEAGRGQLLCQGFARQQWRAWIETRSARECRPAHAGFARQQWRAWIETSPMCSAWRWY